MKIRPILFSALMVRAILAGRKTQTRRILKPQNELANVKCKYGERGDHLWVKENVWIRPKQNAETWPMFIYDADKPDVDWLRLYQWKHLSSIYMPRAASRIKLEIINTTIERLQEISDKNAEAEGADWIFDSCREGFKVLWDSINGKTHPWSSNPLVWVIKFRRIK
jgi:hypothetical protein